MANVIRKYATLDLISTLKKRETLVKQRAFNQSMLTLSDELASEANVIAALMQDRDMPSVLGAQARKAYNMASVAFMAMHRIQREVTPPERTAVLDLMHYAFSLARAIDGNNSPNVAYYGLYLYEAARTVLTLAETK